MFPDEMEAVILNDDNRLYVEEEGSRIIGAILFICEDKETIIKDMEVSEEDYDRISKGLPTLHHKFSIVREDSRGKGLMTRMLADAIDSLEQEKRYGAIFTQGWIRNEQVPMENIFVQNGYVCYKRQIRPWWKYSDRTCSICNGRCRCDAMVYYRSLSLL